MKIRNHQNSVILNHQRRIRNFEFVSTCKQIRNLRWSGCFTDFWSNPWCVWALLCLIDRVPILQHTQTLCGSGNGYQQDRSTTAACANKQPHQIKGQTPPCWRSRRNPANHLRQLGHRSLLPLPEWQVRSKSPCPPRSEWVLSKANCRFAQPWRWSELSDTPNIALQDSPELIPQSAPAMVLRSVGRIMLYTVCVSGICCPMPACLPSMMGRQTAENCHAYVAMQISDFRKNLQLSTVAHDMLRAVGPPFPQENNPAPVATWLYVN